LEEFTGQLQKKKKKIYIIWKKCQYCHHLKHHHHPASPSSCRKKHIVCKLNILFNHFQSKCPLGVENDCNFKKSRHAKKFEDTKGAFRSRNFKKDRNTMVKRQSTIEEPESEG
jgi:hypothetical protein